MEQLGIDSRLLLAQIVNFGVIVVVLSKLLYKPVLSMLEKRKKGIAEGLALADKMKHEQEKIEEKKEKVLTEARKVARAILDQAKKAAKEEATEIVEKAQKQASSILAKGKEEVTQMKKTVEKDMRKEAMNLASEMAIRVLPKTLSAKDQHALLAKHLKEVEAAL